MTRMLSLAAIFAAAFVLPAAAENANVNVPITANGVSSAANGAGSGQGGLATAVNKTSDRTPDNANPQRSPGAGIYGAAGTEVGRTPDGTSDRTPSNHYRPATN